MKKINISCFQSVFILFLVLLVGISLKIFNIPTYGDEFTVKIFSSVLSFIVYIIFG